MYNVRAHAVRAGKAIEVTISGSLPDSCHQARVEDFYPGGKRVYVKDPGAAQVFLEETVKPGSGVCLMYLVPWATTITIPDPTHSKVEVLINGHEVAEVAVAKPTGQFIVIVLTGTTTGCSVIPKDSLYPAIYTKAFGPNTLGACKAWVAANCGA